MHLDADCNSSCNWLRRISGLESMKLEIPVSATRSGEIVSIDTAVEAQVQTDEILLTIR